MEYRSIDGIVVRTSDYGANDRYLSILTAKEGRITLLSKGSRSLKGEQLSISQPFTYCNYEYYRKGNTNILKGGSVLSSFYGIGKNLETMSLAYYLCELVCEVSDEGEEAEELLRLLLNTLYAISVDGKYSQALVKGAFEWRVAAISGYVPDLDVCECCGAAIKGESYLHVMNGALLCEACLRKRGGLRVGDEERGEDILSPLTPSVLAAMRYCIQSPLERLFSFKLSESGDAELFGRVAETYILSHLGRGFGTLEYYHSTLELPK